MTTKVYALCLMSAAAFAAPASAVETIRIAINKLAFSPALVAAHVGDTIQWVSTDFIAHTATARNGDWDIAIPAKSSGKVVLAHIGDVDYYCRFHPNMTGHITVAP